MTDPDFDGCSRPCRTTGVHTLIWGDCAHGPEKARPEPRVSFLRTGIAEDGQSSIYTESFTVPELAKRIEISLRAGLELAQNPPAGYTGVFPLMALAVAMDLAGEQR